MAARSSTPKFRDVPLALESAREFYASVANTVESYRIPLKGSGDHIDPVRTIVVATNVILSCELYLKVARMAEEGVPRISHNLMELFNDICLMNQYEIRSKFEKYINRFPSRYVSTDIIIGNRMPTASYPANATDAEAAAARAKGLDLDTVLRETGDGFKIWRYFYEAMDEETGRFQLTFYHVALECLARSLDEVCRSLLKQASR